MSKFIFITGGVVSSLGKGITAASLGRLLMSRGIKVNMLKCDPYINVDPGTMNPYQHGEVFVTEDGQETDLDLGHYERFLDINLHRDNNITAGQVYGAVIERERRGDYLGQTVQVIPHLTEEIKSRIRKASRGSQAVIVEIGGTVGDIESLPFLEAIRECRQEWGRQNVMFLHVTLVPFIHATEELKTKPTQHSVGKLREIGIDPDLILCRTEKPLERAVKDKIALFGNVEREAVIEVRDVSNTYEVPLLLEKEGLDRLVITRLGLKAHGGDLREWRRLVERIHTASRTLRIAVAGKYVALKDAYKSIHEALVHAGIRLGVAVRVEYIDTESPNLERLLEGADGILVPGGFGDRGIEGKVRVTHFARVRQVPFLGICLGMQCAVVDMARTECGLSRANSTEFDPHTPHPVVDQMNDQPGLGRKGGTMRLGTYPCRIQKGSLSARVYGKQVVLERHRHRYELNNRYRARLERAGLMVSGVNPERGLAEIVEVRGHPWFIAVQFHPEFQSRPLRPHPLFKAFLAAAMNRGNG